MHDQTLEYTTPSDGFKYFSGYAARLHNHPAIHASMDGFTVSAPGVYAKFPPDQLAAAMEFYRKILAESSFYANRVAGG